MDDILNLLKLLFVDHAWAAGGGALCMVFVTLLTDRTRILPTWNNPWRTFLGTLFGALGMGLSQIKNGPGDAAMLISLALTTMPTLVAEFMIVIGKSKPGAPRMVGMTLGFAMLFACVGCGAAKAVCPLVDLASQACPFVMVRYVDDAGVAQVEQIPKGTLELQARQATTMRLAASRDAGAAQ